MKFLLIAVLLVPSLALAQGTYPRNVSISTSQTLGTAQRNRLLLADCTGGDTYTLPTGTSQGTVGDTGQSNFFEIFRTNADGTGDCTIDGNGSDTIEGDLTYVLDQQFELVRVVSVGTSDWKITDARRKYISIGDQILNGTEDSVLFLDAGGVLGQDNDYLKYDSVTHNLTLRAGVYFDGTTANPDKTLINVIDPTDSNIVTVPDTTAMVIPRPVSATAGQFLTALDGTTGVWTKGAAVTTTGTMTATALVTSNGTTVIQTPSATATLDSSGNMSLPGDLATGTACPTCGGAIELLQGTAVTPAANSIVLQAPTSVSTAYSLALPAAAGTGFLLNTDTANVGALTFVGFSGTGNVARVANSTFTNPALGTPSALVLTNATGLPESGLASEDYGDFTCGAGADDCVLDANSVGTGPLNFSYVASHATGIGLTGGAAGSEAAALTTLIDYSLVASGNPALAVSTAAFSSECPSGGFISEGSTADNAEHLQCFTSGNPADTAFYIASASSSPATVGQVLRVTGTGTVDYGALDLSDPDAITNDIPDANLSANVSLLGQTISGSEMVNDTVTSTQLATANKTIIKDITITSPTTSLTNMAQIYWPGVVTLTKVECSVDAGTSVTIQFDERAVATPNTAGTNSMTSSLVCDATSEATTSFSDSSIAAAVPHNLQITGVSGAVTAVRIHITATVN